MFCTVLEHFLPKPSPNPEPYTVCRCVGKFLENNYGCNNGEGRYCTIRGKHFQFGEKEINEALGFKVEGHDTEANDVEMVAFLDLIKYADEIDMAKLNKKHVRRKWSFLFDALQKVFLCRKTGWDHISHIAVKLAYSLAYNQEINVGAIILKELAQRLGRTVRGRGNEIFYPRFLQCILNYLDNNVHELDGIDKTKLAYSKSMSKVLFGALDTRNQVNIILDIHLSGIILNNNSIFII